MTQITVDYTGMIWGPYVSKMKMEKHVVDRLLEDGNQLREDNRKNNYRVFFKFILIILILIFQIKKLFINNL